MKTRNPIVIHYVHDMDRAKSKYQGLPVSRIRKAIGLNSASGHKVQQTDCVFYRRLRRF